MPSTIQSILFSKTKWTETKARQWLKNNKHVDYKIDITKNKLRFRQTDPGPFKMFSTKKIGNGIEFIIGYN
jgi:hypothetical protein